MCTPSDDHKLRTRIRKLIEGCEEVQLNKLTPAEAIKLVLKVGLVEASDEATRAAAQIAQLCEYLRTFSFYLAALIHLLL